MMYVKVTNGIPENYSLSRLRSDNPQVSFPAEPSASTLAEYGVFPLIEVPAPTASATQKVVRGTPQLINGSWTQVWNIVDITAEVTAAKDAQAISEADVLFGKIIFELVNDVRVLKGQGTITKQQFINYLRTKL